MNLYFRAWFAWIPFKVFFPPVFFPQFGQHVGGGFYYPGGFLIGGAMAVNLLAAHGVRFTVQARGARLAAGLAVLALGILLAWLVVLGGSDKELVEGTKGLNIAWLWGGVEAWRSVCFGCRCSTPSGKSSANALGTAAVGQWPACIVGIILQESCSTTAQPRCPIRRPCAFCGSSSKRLRPPWCCWPVAFWSFASGPASSCCMPVVGLMMISRIGRL